MNPEESTPAPEATNTPTTPTTPAAAAPTPMPVSPVSKKSSKGMLFGAIGGAIVVVILLLLAGWFMLWSPAAQSKKLSNAFMHNITTGDVAAATDQTGDATAKTFLTDAGSKLKGDYKLSQSKFTDGKGYYLYNLTGATDKYARTIIEKDSGKRVVSSLVFSNSTLALVPSTSSSSASSSDTATTTTPKTTTLTCLTNDDYKWFEFDNQPPSVTFGTTYNPDGSTDNATDDMFFKPNTTQEDSLSSVYDTWASFASHNTDKQWVFRLEGSTFGPDTATAASQQLANQRAQEVQTQLEKRGVPASRIVIDTPHNYVSESQDDSMDQIYRRVQVVIDPTCTTTAATTPTTSDSDTAR